MAGKLKKQDRLTNPNLDSYGDATMKHNGSILDVLKKLKAYEDINLTPEQVREMKTAWDMYGGEYGITESLKQVRAWISVEDETPEPENEDVLVYDDVTREITTAYLTTDRRWHGMGYQEEHDVSYWMHLPDPPKPV